MAQTLDAEIDHVKFVAKIKGNPSIYTISINGDNTNLNRIDEWKLCHGNNEDIEIDTSFELSVAASEDIADLEELAFVIKYTIP